MRNFLLKKNIFGIYILATICFVFIFIPKTSLAISWGSPDTGGDYVSNWPRFCTFVSATNWIEWGGGSDVHVFECSGTLNNVTPLGTFRVNGCMMCYQSAECSGPITSYDYTLIDNNRQCVANGLPDTGFVSYPGATFNGTSPASAFPQTMPGNHVRWCDPNPSTCGSPSGGSVVTYTVSATPALRSITRGEATTYFVTVTGSSSSSGSASVLLSVNNCPTNSTCTFDTSTINVPDSGSASTILTVQTTGSTPINTYNFTTSAQLAAGGGLGNASHQLVVNNAVSSCNPSLVGTNTFVGCAYSGTSFNTLTGNQLAGYPALTSPVPLSASPLPNTDWGGGGPNGLTNNFSARWKGSFNFPNGNYTFTTRSDDGSRAYVDNNSNGIYDSSTDTLLVSDWSDHGLRNTSGASVQLSGQKTIIYEMYEATLGAGYGLSWAGTPIVSGITSTCDGTYREVPGNGATPSQPAAVYLQPDKTSSAAPDSIAVSVRGTDNKIYYQYCRFNGTNTCTWGGNWVEVPGNGSTSWSPFGQTGGAWDLYHRSSTGNQMHIINWSDNWKGDGNIVNTWISQGADNGWAGWGMSFNPYTSARGLKTQDKLSRWWQFSKGSGSDNKIYYACNSGTPPASSCVNLPFGSATVSPGSVNANGSFTVTCDYQVRGLNSSTLTVTSSPAGISCGNPSWPNSGTAASFACTAPNIGGPYTISCQVNNNATYNACSRTNQIPGSLIVNAPNVTTNISAATNNLPYNTSTTINWSSTNASSCSVSPNGWSGTSGNQSTGNLTTSRTYTVSCLPSGANSSASITVNVQAQPTSGLTVIKSGQGTVTSSPAGINCGSDCTENYPTNTSVTLTANPATGRIFTGWSVAGGGSCPGRGTCNVVMNAPKTVTANFAIDPNYQEF